MTWEVVNARVRVRILVLIFAAECINVDVDRRCIALARDLPRRHAGRSSQWIYCNGCVVTGGHGVACGHYVCGMCEIVRAYPHSKDWQARPHFIGCLHCFTYVSHTRYCSPLLQQIGLHADAVRGKQHRCDATALLLLRVTGFHLWRTIGRGRPLARIVRSNGRRRGRVLPSISPTALFGPIPSSCPSSCSCPHSCPCS